jgi:hypothetical protein
MRQTQTLKFSATPISDAAGVLSKLFVSHKFSPKQFSRLETLWVRIFLFRTQLLHRLFMIDWEAQAPIHFTDI